MYNYTQPVSLCPQCNRDTILTRPVVVRSFPVRTLHPHRRSPPHSITRQLPGHSVDPGLLFDCHYGSRSNNSYVKVRLFAPYLSEFSFTLNAVGLIIGYML